ncbi:alpha/beta superfamily hydrolase [Pseudomonas citronellolis]|uniref:alpha/beta hydrolase n=1 Tax=Pseudomonas citronellolis TaxID=53408 RepID=UPI00209CD9DD|nr:alpha/beta hydrolase [Pseudomonas citronellolis]MCP1645998.1 alpha/beta superfamily hydrolase [Pseudomonas citronellolis]MCP1669032.1 alpha/beta superfamily hydrolase [Pseudomonas citronellolis]MCP1700396.1 alpha/beta superfamily hydrolase [Pseudomonas citronellolis]MCP1706760.1 alpha/beta superfamily hydrolase [Pseudomonas citronellolis]MCP1800625.1 alpha/beta superfamily hydrolase [Pseudomonas citronellolis]
MSTREIPLFIDGPDGPLEALHLDTPDAIGVALICHPHPLFAGTMQNKVVATLQRIARDAGYATLRFNFRGVGQSAGSYAEGRGEIDDALAVARWLGERHPGLPLTLMGFSFGSCVAGNAAARLEGQGVALRHLFMLAPPVERFAVELPRQCPITVVQPEDDEVVTPARVYAWSESLTLPHELLRVPGCSHFFHGKLIELKDLLQPRLAPAGAAG